MSRSLRILPDFIPRVKSALQQQGFARQQDLANKLEMSLTTVNKYFNAKSVDYLYFVEISEQLGQDWREIAAFEDSSSNRGQCNEKVEKEVVMTDCLEEDSLIYVERPPIEESCYEALLHPGALIRIKAPTMMGKTLLMVRILDQLVQSGYRSACLNLNLANRTDFTDVDQFFKWFCISVGQSLGIPNQLAEYWDEAYSTSKIDCTEYFEKYLLPQAGSPVVLCLDEVDRVFPYREVASEFLGLLRAWHERGKVEKVWKQLRLVVIHSTEVYIPLNINESPFNVGLAIELPEFSLSQVQELARQHGQDWSQAAVEQLMEIVGGHPYLVEQAFCHYHINGKDSDSLEQLLEVAPTEAGIYANHLRHLWRILQQHPDLAEALLKIIDADCPVRLEPMQTYKLHSMGLVKKQGNKVVLSCNLYRQYFKEHLSQE